MTSNFLSNKSTCLQTSAIVDNEKNRSAAFRGASHTFSRAPSTTNVHPAKTRGADAALTAASVAGVHRREKEMSQERAPSNRLQIGKASLRRSGTSASCHLRDYAQNTNLSREQSPTNVASLPITGSSTSPTRRTSPIPRPSTLNDTNEIRNGDHTNEATTGDVNTLVNLFEPKQKQKPRASNPVVHSVRYVNRSTPVATDTEFSISTMRPVPFTTIPAHSGSDANIQSKPNAKSAVNVQGGITAEASANSSSLRRISSIRQEPPASKSISAIEVSSLNKSRTFSAVDGPNEFDRASMAATRQAHPANVLSPGSTELFLNDAAVNLQSRPARSSARPILPARRTEPAGLPPSRSPNIKSRPALLPFPDSRESIDAVRPSRKSMQASDSYVPQLSVDSLANAMVASSIASSRAPSPSKPPPVPPPRRHGKHSLFSQSRNQEASRTPSPAKGMRQTMREPPKSDDEDVIRKHRKHHINKHPNKHNEGDRKRYRTQVTDRERKRYEGVWAANRGIFLPPMSQNAVINIVARDIWKRSRLPDDVLEEVWDLVDNQRVGTLERDEFVVGMWLIDQRLKGNKLPTRVSDSVWGSVRHLAGVNLTRERK